MRHRIFKYIGIVLSAAVLLTVLAYIIAVNPPGEGLIKSWLENKLTAETGLPVAVGEFETNLWSRVQLSRLVMLKNTDMAGDTVLKIEKIEIHYGLFDLLGDRVQLRSLFIDSVDMKLAIDSLGHLGIPVIDALPEESAETDTKPLAIGIDTVFLDHVYAGINENRIPLTVQLFNAVTRVHSSVTDSYAGELAVDSICTDYNNVPLCISSLQISMAYNGKTLNIDSARAQIDDLKWRANGTISGKRFDSLSISAIIDGNPDKLLNNIGSHMDMPEMTAEKFRLQGYVGGTFDKPDLSIQMQTWNSRIAEIDIPSAVINARYVADSLLIDSLYVTSIGGSLTGKGLIIPDSTFEADLALDVDNLAVADLWLIIYGETPPYAGRITGAAQIVGKGNDIADWSVGADLRATRLRYEEKEIPDLDFQLSLAGQVAKISFQHGNDKIDAAVDMRHEALGGNFDMNIPDISSLARFFNQPDLSGYFKASGTINGTLDNPRIRAEIDGHDISYQNFPVDTLKADIRYEDSVLSIIGASCSGNIETVNRERPPFNIDSLGGGLKYRCQLDGSLDSLSSTFEAALASPRYGTYYVDSSFINGILSGSRIELTRLDIYRADLVLRGTAVYDTLSSYATIGLNFLTYNAATQTEDIYGDPVRTPARFTDRGELTSDIRFKPDSTFVFNVHTKNLWVGISRYFTDDSILTDGSLNFDLAFDGRPANFDASLRLAANLVQTQDIRIDSIFVLADLHANTLSIKNLEMTVAGQTLVAGGTMILSRTEDGIVAIDKNTTLSGKFSADNFDLAVLQNWVLPDGAISGNISALMTVDGRLSSPQIDGWLRLDSGRLQLEPQTRPMENLYLDLSFSGDSLHIDSAAATIEGWPVTIHGDVKTRSFKDADVNLQLVLSDIGSFKSSGYIASDRLDLKIVAHNIALAAARPFLPGIDSLGGQLFSDITVTGSRDEPVVNGSISLSDVSLYSSLYYLRLSNGFAGLRFDRQHIYVDSLMSSLNGGTLYLSGNITRDISTITDINLELQAKAITFNDPELYLINIENASLNYSRHEDIYVLDGDIQPGETKLTARFRPQTILPWVQSSETIESPFLEKIPSTRLDIRIRESSNLWVDNNLARIRLKAALGVIGTPARPNLTGMMNIEEGYLLYLDRRFKVNEGTFYFSDPVHINPDITLAAATNVTTYQRMTATSYDIFIKMDGPMDELRVDLYSEPPLEKPDIVALLTLGATRTQLAGKGEGDQGGIKSVLTERTAMLASRRVSNYVSDKVGSFFGFNEFTIQGNLFRPEQESGPKLVASRQISDRAELTYSTAVGHLNDQSVRLEYKLTPRLSLLSETNRYGKSTIDLKYGIKFR